MKEKQKVKLVVDNAVKEKTQTPVMQKTTVTNPIYGRYLEFTSKKTKKKITLRDFLNELF